MEAPLSARAALVQALVVPGYGAELVERLRGATGGRMRVSMGSIYPALRGLETRGLVRSRLVRARRGAGRPRRYFELTLRGVAARNSERRAVAALFRLDVGPSSREPAARIGDRLTRCSRASASALELRRRILDGRGGE